MRRLKTVATATAGVVVALAACNQLAGIDSGIPAVATAEAGGATAAGSTGIGGASAGGSQPSSATTSASATGAGGTSVTGASATTTATSAAGTGGTGASVTAASASETSAAGTGGTATGAGVTSTAGTGGASSVTSGAGAASAASGSGGGCPPGFADCDGTGSCATDLTSTTNHCGTCSHACTSPRGTWSCKASTCQFSGCQAGYASCKPGGTPEDCETPLGTLTDCTTCGDACVYDHAAAQCTASGCKPGACTTGWDECDGKTNTVCETSLDDPNHCGTCTQVCPYGVCRSLTCAPVIPFGPTGPGTTDEAEGSNYFIATQIYVSAPSTLVALGANTTTANASIRFALYTDAPGAPENIVTQTNPVTSINGATEALTTQVALAKGYYWVAFVASSAGNVRLRKESGMVTRWSGAFAYGAFTDPPPPLSSTTLNALDLYAKVVQP